MFDSRPTDSWSMFPTRLRRLLLWRWARVFLGLFVALNLLDVLRVRRNLVASQLASNISPARTRHERIFIASTHWNNENILRSHWNQAILNLAEYFGPDNIYVSVYESGSWDDSKGALRELDQSLDALNVRRSIVLDPTTHSDEIEKAPAQSGWIDTPRGKRELRRIPYLAQLRNRSLRPLEDLALTGLKYDKILFLNDVVFTVRSSGLVETCLQFTDLEFQLNDVVSLLNTNNGNYAAACALDFSKPPQYYDTFALRDSEGREPVMQTWPYFAARASRHAIKSASPTPVASCWNGMGE